MNWHCLFILASKKMFHKIVDAEKLGESEYNLITEAGNSYFYRLIDTTRESFLKEEKRWRERVMEGEQILLDWIENRTNRPPIAEIYWNYQRMAMLKVPLRTIFNAEPSDNIYGSEINPLDNKDADGWVIDKACPLPSRA